jgi:phosphatidylglycerophosphate synthase
VAATGALHFIPNLLTVLRFLLAFAFPFAGAEARVALLVGALLTEFLDGQFARRFGWESRAGRILDPIADRALFGTVAITFLVEGRLDGWTLGALGARDALVVLGALWCAARGQARVLRTMKPRLAGKVTTALQYVVLLCLVFGIAPPWPLALATLAVGLVAAGQYLADARRLAAVP